MIASVIDLNGVALTPEPCSLARTAGDLLRAAIGRARHSGIERSLAHSAGVNTIPTSAITNARASMSTHASLPSERALHLTRHVLAVDVSRARQALDFHAPLTSSPPLMRVRLVVRECVPTRIDDRARPPFAREWSN